MEKIFYFCFYEKYYHVLKLWNKNSFFRKLVLEENFFQDKSWVSKNLSIFFISTNKIKQKKVACRTINFITIEQSIKEHLWFKCVSISDEKSLYVWVWSFVLQNSWFPDSKTWWKEYEVTKSRYAYRIKWCVFGEDGKLNE